jgi:serine-protein kinase ATM
VLRKIRVLVALAGPEAVQGYALEMLLQSLQPYIIKFYCAEDAIGIFWYLLDEGRGYLQQNMSLLCGIGLTTLLSLSAFLSSPQDSTTQESHYLLTLSITQSFQKWFIDFLAIFSTETHAGGGATTFKTIITYAGEVRPPGRADKDSVEGKLLLELLEARTSVGEMLSPASFKTAVQLLCNSFTRPVKPEEDILGQDSIAIRHARVLWSLVGEIDAAEEFWTWLSEALGRSYAASGVVDPTLTMEHSHELFRSQSLSSQSSRASRSLIVDNLHDLLRSDDYTAASLAEKTLQQMITQVASQKSLEDYDECVSLAMIRSLNWYPSPCPDIIGFKKDSLGSNEHAVLDLAIAPAKWASQFTVSLLSSVRDDPLLGALIPILSRLPSLAVRILPLVVHNFLAVDTRDGQPHRRKVSEAFTGLLLDDSPKLATQRRLVLSTLLYLRCQPSRTETTIADRTSWLEIDLSTAAAAAASCTMYKSALLLLELHASQLATQSSRSSRRSLTTKVIESPDLLRQIYQNLDDPDFFYGMEEVASLSSVMRKLGHEGENFKNLSFQSAVFDSGIKSDIDEHSGLLEALVSANMNGVARAVQAQLAPEVGQRSDTRVGPSLTALNLHQWDLPISSTASDPSSLLFQVFQAANISMDISEVLKRLAAASLTLVKSISQEHIVGNDLRYSMSALAALTELKEALSSRSSAELAAYWLKLEQREKWQEFEK